MKFLLFFVGLIFLTGSLGAARPNILLILTDDHRWDLSLIHI